MMADAVVFTLEAQDNFSKVLDKIAKRFRDMDSMFGKVASSGVSAFNKLQKGIRAFGSKALEVAKRMQDGFKKAFKAVAGFAGTALKGVLAGFAGIGVAVGLAVREATKFDTAMREVISLTDEGSDTLEKWKREIIEFSTKTADGPVNVANSFFSLISASRQGAGQFGVLKAASNLAVSGFTDMDSALKLVVTGLNAFNLGSDKAERIADLLFTTIREGQTRFELLSNFIPKVFAATADVGFDPSIGLAAFATLTSALGEKLNPEVATGISAAIKAIYDPKITKGTPTAVANLFKNIQSLPLEQAVKKIKDFLETIQDSGERFRTLQIIAGSEPAAQALGILTRNFETFQQKLEAFSQAGGASGNAAAVIMDSLGFQSARLSSNIKAAAISFGDALLPALTVVTTKFAQMFGILAGFNWVQFWRGITGGGNVLPELGDLLGFVREQFLSLGANFDTTLADVLLAFGESVQLIASTVWKPVEVAFLNMVDKIMVQLKIEFLKVLADIAEEASKSFLARRLGLTEETATALRTQAKSLAFKDTLVGEPKRAARAEAAREEFVTALSEVPKAIGASVELALHSVTEAFAVLGDKFEAVGAVTQAGAATTPSDIMALNELTGGGAAPAGDMAGAAGQANVAKATADLGDVIVERSRRESVFVAKTIEAIENTQEALETDADTFEDRIKRLEETLAKSEDLLNTSKRRSNVPAPA